MYFMCKEKDHYKNKCPKRRTKKDMKRSLNPKFAPKISFKFPTTYNILCDLDNEIASSNFYDVVGYNKNIRADLSRIITGKVYVENENSRIKIKKKIKI